MFFYVLLKLGFFFGCEPHIECRQIGDNQYSCDGYMRCG